LSPIIHAISGGIVRLRAATLSDRDAIHAVHWSAFGEDERELVARLAVELLSEQTTPPTLSLVAETEGNVVGHAAFSPVTAHGVEEFSGYILAPLAVRPDHQRCHIGSLLVASGIGRLSEMGTDFLLVYGDPEYYGRFGFSVDAAGRCVPPYQLEYPMGWQGVVLSERGIGASTLKLDCVASLRDPALW
jgi:putative acetyltransferase